MDKCKYCEQEAKGCICTKVDRFFSDNWDLMYIWHERKQVQFAYAFPKAKNKTDKVNPEPVSGAW